jgi:hypothetical protein
MVLTCWEAPKDKGRARFPDYKLPGMVRQVDLEEESFEVLTLINDGNEGTGFPLEWYSYEPNDEWEPLEKMEEPARLHLIVDHLQEHTRRLNVHVRAGEPFVGIEPQTCFIETSKGDLMMQGYRDNQGARPRLVKLNGQTITKIRWKGVHDLMDKIADKACADLFPTPKRRSQSEPQKRRTRDALDTDSEEEDSDFIPKRSCCDATSSRSRRSDGGDANTSAAHTGGTRASRAEDEATGSRDGGASTALVSFGGGQIPDDESHSGEPETGLSLDSLNRNPAVDPSNIRSQEILVRKLKAELKAENRTLGRQVQHLCHHVKSLSDQSFNPINLREGDEVQCAAQLLHARNQFQSNTDALYDDLADKREHIRECDHKFQRAAALLGHMKHLLNCQEQLRAVQLRMYEADEAVSRAFITRKTSPGVLTEASHRLEAVKSELERLTKKEDEALVACRENLGPPSD